MATELHERIRNRLESLGKTPTEVSKSAGLSSQFLRTFFNRPDSSMKSASLIKIARALNTTPEWLLGEHDDPEPDPPAPATDTATSTDQPPPVRDLPVLGVASASVIGDNLLSREPIDFAVRPPTMTGARDAYVLWVTGDSMQPRFEPGEPIVAHPQKPVREGDYVIVTLEEGGGHKALVKRLKARENGKVELEQLHPRATMWLNQPQIKAMHRVMSWSEIIGI